jgi:hypothetical protein
MFDFLRGHFFRGHSERPKSEQARPGVQLLASVLVCFPEIEAVSYDPAHGLLTMDFVVRAEISPAEMEAFSSFLAESIETYHLIEGGTAGTIDFSYEQHAPLTMIHLARRMDELSERELSLIVQLLAGRFGKELLVDAHGVGVLDTEFSAIQHETLERMLTAVREIPLRERLVGIRERDQVVVYNR